MNPFLAIYYALSWFLSSKNLQVASSKIFPKCFHLKSYSYSDIFSVNKKDWNHLVQCLLNMVDEADKASVNPILYVCFLLKVTLYYYKKHNVSQIDVFLGFHAHATAIERIECIWLHCVSNCSLKFKMPRWPPPHTQHDFSSSQLCLCGGAEDLPLLIISHLR